MKPKQIRKLLMSKIKDVADHVQDYCFNPNKDFSRKRKIDAPSASAFVQQREKVKPDAFKNIFDSFSAELLSSFDDDFPILAVDGSDVQIATNPKEHESHFPPFATPPLKLSPGIEQKGTLYFKNTECL